MIWAYSLLGASALLIAYQDIRHQMIPLGGLILFSSAALLNHLNNPNLEGLWAAGIIAITLGICQANFCWFKRNPAMGVGDLILAPLCGLWLQLDEIPFFLFFTGLFALPMGVFWRYWWGMRTFPFGPAILLGLGSILLIRCF